MTVAGGAKATLDVTLNVPVATVGDSSAFREVAGLVTLTPGAGQNNGVALRVPYYLVPRALSNVSTKVNIHTLKSSSPSTTANVKNGGPIAGDADFYAWGLQDGKDEGRVSNDLRAVGVQSFEWDPTQQLLVFAVNVWDRWSNAASNEFDIAIDVDNDGTVDYFVVGVDIGAVTTGDFNGQMGTFVFSTRSAGASVLFPGICSD